MAQSNFGIELRASRNITINSGVVEGETIFFNSKIVVSKEENPITLSYSIGAYYRITKNHMFKLHFGWHQNGRIYDLVYQEEWQFYPYERWDRAYQYYEITPSYCYQINIGRLRLPIELGVRINKLIYRDDTFIHVKEYNYDLRMALGVSYALTDHFNVGINGLFANALEAYQDEKVTGTYKPRQFGLELSLMYDL